MQTMLIDFIPVFLFFAAFKLYGIYVATGVGIVATLFQVIFTRWTKKSYDKQQLITLAAFVIFGGMTIYFHNPIFIKMKPSIVFGLFGLIFLGSQVIGEKNVAERMMGTTIETQGITISKSIWTRLNIAWALFFLSLSAVNLYVAYHYSDEVWVNFKVYGILACVIAFSLLQAVCLSRYMKANP